MARLFIPGPTDVDPEVLGAQAQPMVGHRSAALSELFASLQPRLRQVFRTEGRVYLIASSGTGLIEGALRNCVGRRLLACTCGAFGERWAEAAEANGLACDRLAVEWGQPNLPEQVERALRQADHDALMVVHNETSTGVENPLQRLVAAARAVRPELVILVDAVSSAGGVPLETDAWGLDVVITSSQKCMALPPGLAFAAVSDRALERARSIPRRGWYFDFLRLEAALLRSTTPATPAISLLYALDRQLDRMLAEGLQARQERHRQLAQMAQAWAADRFGLFAAEGYRARTVTAVVNTRSLDVGALNAHLAQQGMSLAYGYGRLRGSTFRIGHMGEIRPAELQALLERIDDFLRAG
jgi:predicted phosphoserine aminotransferase